MVMQHFIKDNLPIDLPTVKYKTSKKGGIFIHNDITFHQWTVLIWCKRVFHKDNSEKVKKPFGLCIQFL